MSGFASIANEMAASGGTDVKFPLASAPSMAVNVPDDAMPVLPPAITAETISSMPLFQDQNFTNPELIVTPVTPLQTLSPTFDVFTTNQMLLSLDSAYIAFRANVNKWTGYNRADTPYDIIDTEGSNLTFQEGGFWDLVQNMTISINGVPMPNYQSGNVIAQLYTHPVVHPATYDGGVGTAINTQIATMSGTMGVDQFFNRRKQGQIKPYMDWCCATATGTTAALPGNNSQTGGQVYFKIPLKNIWTFYQQPGRFMTNDAKLRFQFVLSGLQITATQTINMNPAFSGPTVGVVAAGNAYPQLPNLSVLSQPVLFTFTDMYMCFPLYNTTEQLQQQTTAIVAERPLSMLMNNVEVYNDTFYQNLDLTQYQNWGLGPNRYLIKGSGYLPHHWVMVPTVTVTWGSQALGTGATTVWPFGVANLVWKRNIICPGLLYARRILLGGQPYYDDQLLSMWGVSQVLKSMGGWVYFQEKRIRQLQQQNNYLTAPDQQWLNNYANNAQLNPMFQYSLSTYNQYTSAGITGAAYVTAGVWNLAAQFFAYISGCGINGMSLSQDPSFDTLVDSRQQSFEVETISAPLWGGVMTTATDVSFVQSPFWCKLPFSFADNVSYPQVASGTNLPVGDYVRATPTAVTMSVQHALPYIMSVDYGRGRNTQYNFIQTAMPSTTNVPM